MVGRRWGDSRIADKVDDSFDDGDNDDDHGATSLIRLARPMDDDKDDDDAAKDDNSARDPPNRGMNAASTEPVPVPVPPNPIITVHNIIARKEFGFIFFSFSRIKVQGGIIRRWVNTTKKVNGMNAETQPVRL